MRCPMLAAFLDLCPAFGTFVDLHLTNVGGRQDTQEYIQKEKVLCIIWIFTILTDVENIFKEFPMFFPLLFADEGKLTVLSQKLQFNFTNHCGSQISKRLSYFNPTFRPFISWTFFNTIPQSTHTFLWIKSLFPFDCNLLLENI